MNAVRSRAVSFPSPAYPFHAETEYAGQSGIDEFRGPVGSARELDPIAPTLWLNEVLILVAIGHLHEAKSAAERFVAFHRDSSASAFALGMVQEVRGEHERAAASFTRAAELGGGALGEADEAFRWLDRAVAVRDDWLPFIDSWPRYEAIRQDPRFLELRRRIGLPEVASRRTLRTR